VGLIDRILPSVRMRRDWDRRAREDARRFIACGHSDSEEAFWASGRRDLDERVLHGVALTPAARALEIGCGMGRLLLPLSERVARADGVDISPEMVVRAREALAGRPNVRISVTDGTLSEFADASLDFVFSFIVFQHVPSKRAVRRYVREGARVLKGRGIFRFQVDSRPRRRRALPDTWLGVWYAEDELRRELERAGFEVADLWGGGTHYLWATAVRREETERAASDAAAARKREWNDGELAALVARLGESPASAEAVGRGERSLRRLADSFLERHAASPPEGFVRAAYGAVLGRDPDPDGLAFYAREIEEGVDRANTVDCLFASSELEDRLKPMQPSA